MKETYHKTRGIAVLISLIFLLILPAFPLVERMGGGALAQVSKGAEETAQMKATIAKVVGGVRIRTRGTIFWHDAKVNEVLGSGDQIETKKDGNIEIKLENDNVINLKPNSKLILQKLTKDLKTGEYENLLESNIGKIRAKVEKIKGNSKFEIKTPTAVACVRGTTIYLDILPALTVAFFEGGEGTFTNTISGSTETVGDGETSSSDNQGNLSESTEASSDQQSEWQGGWDVGGGGEGYTPPEGGEPGAAVPSVPGGEFPPPTVEDPASPI